MNRITIIQSLIDKRNYKSYLEIGVRDGSCFNVINCENKVGVDPDLSSAATVYLTSDEFFKENELQFDICFVDGYHEKAQAERDVLNCLKFLKEGGTIIMHDCLPTNEFMQLVPLTTQNEWVGSVWEGFVKLRMERGDLTMDVIDTDWGCAVIQRGKQDLLKVNTPINYANFVKNKKHWMNIISPDQFKQKYL